jgi:malonate decarboxylase beta subunit
VLVEDDVDAFRAAATAALDASRPVTPESLEAENALLRARMALFELPVAGDEATALWSRLGVPQAARVGDLDVAAVRALRIEQEGRR